MPIAREPEFPPGRIKSRGKRRVIPSQPIEIAWEETRHFLAGDLDRVGGNLAGPSCGIDLRSYDSGRLRKRNARFLQRTRITM